MVLRFVKCLLVYLPTYVGVMCKCIVTIDKMLV